MLVSSAIAIGYKHGYVMLRYPYGALSLHLRTWPARGLLEGKVGQGSGGFGFGRGGAMIAEVDHA